MLTKLMIIIFMNFKILLTKIPCNPDSFRFSKFHDTVEVNKRYTFRITNQEEIGCAINASFLWEMFEVEFDELKPYLKSEIVLEFTKPIKTRKNRLIFPPSINYKTVFGKTFVIKVTLIPPVSFFKSYRMHRFTVEKEKYNFEIIGGSFQVHVLGTGSLWLNLTAKRQIEEPVKLTNIAWSCFPPLIGNAMRNVTNLEVLEIALRKQDRLECSVTAISMPEKHELKASQNIKVLPMRDKPSIEVKCVSNCPFGNAFKVTLLKYICYGACQSKAAWSIRPFDEDIQDKLQYSTIPEHVIIPPGTFKHGMSYEILAFLGEETAQYRLNFRLPTFNLSIHCYVNCYKRHKEIVFGVECAGECQGIEYKWEALPHPKAWNWTYMDLTFMSNGTFLTFPPFFFPRLTGAQLKVHDLDRKASITFVVDFFSPQLYIECRTPHGSCIRPNAAEDVFLIVRCKNNCDAFNYTWNINSTVNFNWMLHVTEDRQLLRIPPNTFTGGFVFEATLFVDDIIKGATVSYHYADPPDIDIMCVRNCDEKQGFKFFESNPFRPVFLEVECKGVCDNILYEWTLSPHNHDMVIHTLTNNTQLFISGNTYKPGETVAIRVEGSGAVDTYELKFLVPEPKLALYCLDNCFNPANPAHDMRLRVVCLKDCDDITYRWEVITNETFFWYDDIALSFRNLTIIIKKEFLKRNKKATVKAMTDPSQVEVEYSFNVKNVSPQFKLICLDNCPNSWTHQPVKIQLSCSENCRNSTFEWTIMKGSVALPLMPYTNKATNYYIELKKNKFDDGARVVVKAQAVDASEIIVIHYKGYTPSLDIKCSPQDCNYPINVFGKSTFYAKCKLNQFCIDSDLIWKIYPEQTKIFWANFVTLGIRNKSISINYPDFENFQKITISVSSSFEEVNKTVIFEKPKPLIKIDCVHNCNHSNPHDHVNLRGTCTHLCESVTSYDWKLHPLPNNEPDVKAWSIQKTAKIYQLLIPPNTYKDGDVVFTNLTMGGTIARYTIAFVEPSPTLQIACLSNCEFSLLYQAVIGVNCLKNCIVPYKYKWAFKPKSSYVQVVNEGRALIVPPNAYKHKQKVLFKVCLGKSCINEVFTFTLGVSVFEILCVHNCDANNVANPRKITGIIMSCKRNCEYPSRYNKWSINQKTIADTEAKGTKGAVYLQSHATRLVISPNTYLNETIVLVGLSRGDIHREIQIQFFQPDPIFRIICEQNCGYSNPLFDTSYSAKCFKHCSHVTYTWTVAPLPINKRSINILKSGSCLIITKNAYRHGDKVVLRIKGTGLLKEHTIIFTEKPPILVISCPDCNAAHPNSSVIITAHCIDFCQDIFYIWDINPKPPDFHWELKTTLSKSNNSLIIHPHTFRNGSQVQIKLESKYFCEYYLSINYKSSIPTLALNCTSNCEFEVETEVKFQVSCKGYCHGFENNLKCSISPEDPYKPGMQRHLTEILIYAFYFKPDTEVTLTCLYRETETSITFTYSKLQLDRLCAISPQEGVSAETNFSLECLNFPEKTTYSIYQYIPSIDREMLIVTSKQPFISEIYFAGAEFSIIEVYIGGILGYNPMDTVRLWVSVTNFLYDKIGADSQLNKLAEQEILKKISQFEIFIKKRQFDRAMQLIFAVMSDLNSYNLLEYYQYKIINILIPFTDQFEPFQVVSLINMLHFFEKHFKVLIWSQNVEMLTRAAKQMARMNDTLKDRGINSRAFLYFHGLWISTMQDIWKVQAFHDRKAKFDKIYWDPSLGRPLYPLHARYIASNVITIFDVATLLLAEEDHPVEFLITGVIISVMSNLTSSENTLTIPSNKSGSYVMLSPTAYQSKEHRIIIRFIAVYLNVFHWLLFDELNNADAFYFSVTDSSRNHLEGLFEAHVKLQKGRETTTKTFQIINDFFIFGIMVPTYSTLELSMIGSNITVAVSTGILNRADVELNGFLLNGFEIIFMDGKDSLIYVSGVGTGFINFTFGGLKCMSWHGNTWDWDQENCKVSHKQTDAEHVDCVCTLSSVITADSKTLQFKSKFLNSPYNQKVKRQPSLSIIFASLIIFSIICVCSIYFIRYLRTYDVIHYLQDNNPEDTEVYLVIVQTGILWKSGTTARVSIQIIGRNAVSKPHMLNAFLPHTLQRNSCDSFIMKEPKSLGEIRMIRVWHDSDGLSPNWFCDTIVIQHLATRTYYRFFISRWFSLVHFPGTTRGLFKPIRKNRKVPFRSKIEAALRENHNSFWFFTNKKTMNIGISIITNVMAILTIMAVAAMVAKSNDSKFDLLINALIVVIASELIILIIDKSFRRLRPT